MKMNFLSRWNLNPSLRAFSLIELSVVLGIVGLLAGLILVSLANARELGRSAICQTNLGQLSLAWTLYADDAAGRLVGNLGDARVRLLSNSNATWVLGWIDEDGGGELQANTNKYLLRQSPLTYYLGGTTQPFKCPSDRLSSCPRVRSMSMNGYVGSLTRSFTAGYQTFATQSSFARMRTGASGLFVMLDERSDSINDGTFYVAMDGDGITRGDKRLIDYPASYHVGGGNLSFADGHVERRRWLENATTPPVVPCGRLGFRGLMPGNRDVAWLQARATSP